MKKNKLVILNKKIAPVLLTVTLAGNAILCSTPATALAADDSTDKEEIVYGILDNSGNVTGIYVVNSFTDNDIVDYGTYTNIKNLTTTDQITTDGDRITFHTDAAKVYYQGDLETKEIPWNIDIHYMIDGKEYSPQEIAGKSGKLEITISITQNKKCDKTFWEGYALQASLSLDTKKCTNITSENATIANVGSKKQLSYIVMPGKGADITITADVTDFEMDAISINGTKLNLNFDLDDQELLDKVTEIQDAIKELNDGSFNLDNGAKKLGDGTKSLYDGAVSLQDGAGSLNDGAGTLNDGIKTVQTALDTLNKKSDTLTDGSSQVLEALETIQTSLNKVNIDAKNLTALSSASTQINSGISSLVKGLKSIDGSIDSYYSSLSSAGIKDINDYVAKHNQAISALSITDTQRALYQAYTSSGNSGVMQKLSALVQGGDKEAGTLYQQYKAAGNDTKIITNYVTTAGKLISAETLLKGDVSYIQGSNKLISGISAALDSKNGELMKGALSLQSNYKAFHSNIQSLTKSLSSLATNMNALKSGINTLVTNYKKIDSGMNEYTDAVAKLADGYNDICKGSLDVANGTSKLYNGTKDLVDGALELYNGSKDLKDGTKELSDGTNEFFEKTENMDSDITDTINDTIDEMTGKNIDTISFVSEKNTNVASVLFVIKTPSIEIPEEEEPTAKEEEHLSFGQKFLRLFGIK